jgi:hypothetical protein
VDDDGAGFFQGLSRGVALFFVVFVGFEVDDVDLLGDGGGGGGLVARDHDDLDAGGFAFFYGEGHGLFGWVHQREQSDEHKVLRREIESIRTGSHKREIPRKLLLIQMQLGKP